MAPLNGGWPTGKYQRPVDDPLARSNRQPDHVDHGKAAIASEKRALMDQLLIRTPGLGAGRAHHTSLPRPRVMRGASEEDDELGEDDLHQHRDRKRQCVRRANAVIGSLFIDKGQHRRLCLETCHGAGQA